MQVGRLQLHSTSLLGGLLVIAVGLLGVDAEAEARLQEAVSRISAQADLLALAAVGVLATGALLHR